MIAGSNIGNLLGFLLSGLLCQYGFDGGWPSVFYVFGERPNNRKKFIGLALQIHWHVILRWGFEKQG